MKVTLGQSFCPYKEAVLFGRFNMYWNYREKILWGLNLGPL